MRLKAIASGSNGNSIYVGSDHTHILVDAGITAKRIMMGLNETGIDPGELSGICITHEHSDHIQGLRVFLKKYPVTVYGTLGTLQEIIDHDVKGEIDPALFKVIVPGKDFQIGDVTVSAIHTSHDARDSSAYRFFNGDKSCAVMTDLGTYTKETIDFLRGVNGILLEANHDIRMLETGSYPYSLKRRILGNFGHLSNDNSGRLLNSILHDDLEHVLLGHLSDENNYPELALLSVQSEIDCSDNHYKSRDFDITVARRDMSSPIFEV